MLFNVLFGIYKILQQDALKMDLLWGLKEEKNAQKEDERTIS